MRWETRTKIKKHIHKKYPRVISDLLVQRGIESAKEAERFFGPSLEDMHDANLLPDMQKAVKRILEAVKKKERIVIYGDYDVDGVTASALLWDFLYRKLEADAVVFIPSRFDEGYGLNKEALSKVIEEGAKLVITVDCGVKDRSLIDEFKEVDFIVTDHHTLPEEQEWDYPVVHPKLKASKYPFQEISAAVVALKLVQALAKEAGIKEFDITQYLDLAALSTVCDIMPLVDENRAIVALGLKQMVQTQNIGLKALIDVADLRGQDLKAYHLGFALGPRINAAGRIAHAMDAVRLLTTQNIQAAKSLAIKLNDLNEERQGLTLQYLEAAQAQVNISANKKLLFVWGDDWGEGIVGLIAGKLTEQYGRPVLCATCKDGMLTGSARSIAGFDITQAIGSHSDKLVRFGGHAMAAGFTLEQTRLAEFREALEQLAQEQIQESQLEPILNIDLQIGLGETSIELARELEKFEPHGYKNPQIIFCFNALQVIDKRMIGAGGKHIKLELMDREGKRIDAIGFNIASSFQNVKLNDRIDIAANLDINAWNGFESVQLKLKDFKPNNEKK